MSLIDRFFGRRAATDRFKPVANPALENPLSLQLLFDQPPVYDPVALARALRKAHPSLSRARFEIDPDSALAGTPIGLVSFGKHVVRFLGFPAPLPADVIRPCLDAAGYDPALKARAAAHKAHALLYYGGKHDQALEQYVTLALVAGVLARHGAIVVVNEAARTSFPAAALAAGADVPDLLAALRHLPPLLLYSGFVKYELQGVKGVWMRTHGNHLLGLPDFAMRASSHRAAQRVFELFCSLMGYLSTTGAALDDGHTAQVGENVTVRFRAPRPSELFLDSPSELFVLEKVRKRKGAPGSMG